MNNPFEGRLKLPVIAAPMFLTSGPDLVTACCKEGVVGTFPALNQRSTEGFVDWLNVIEDNLSKIDNPAPYGVNLIVHRTNSRLQADLEQCVAHKVPLVITSLGAVRDVVDAVHSYGGLVFHDIVSRRHAEKAIAAGVDGLILVAAGAGGHAGTLNPYAFVDEIRQIFDGYICLAGCLNNGRQVAAAEMAGADFAYCGTRFIATQEAMSPEAYKSMITETTAKDIVYTDAVSGIPANFLKPSLDHAGFDLERDRHQGRVDMDSELGSDAKAWKDLWSAGHGVGGIQDVPGCADMIRSMREEYKAACEDMVARRKRYAI